MWRETNIGGVFLPPFIVYAAAALVVFLPVRWALLRLGLMRWTWNPRLASAAIYMCILGALIGLF